jgi:hypothetical protein
MNAISRVAYTNDNDDFARTAARESDLTLGLGPNQLTWLRRNIDSFKHAEEQRRAMRQDVVRAARIAGLG